jgi:hypothetical protein
MTPRRIFVTSPAMSALITRWRCAGGTATGAALSPAGVVVHRPRPGNAAVAVAEARDVHHERLDIEDRVVTVAGSAEPYRVQVIADDLFLGAVLLDPDRVFQLDYLALQARCAGRIIGSSLDQGGCALDLGAAVPVVHEGAQGPCQVQWPAGPEPRVRDGHDRALHRGGNLRQRDVQPVLGEERARDRAVTGHDGRPLGQCGSTSLTPWPSARERQAAATR